MQVVLPDLATRVKPTIMRFFFGYKCFSILVRVNGDHIADGGANGT